MLVRLQEGVQAIFLGKKLTVFEKFKFGCFWVKNLKMAVTFEPFVALRPAVSQIKATDGPVQGQVELN